MSRPARAERRPLPAGFGVLWSTVALDLIGFGIAIPVLSLFAKERFGASPTMAGLLFASFSLAQFLMAPLLGRWSDRIGRKPVILISLFGTAVGSLLTGAAVGLWMLFLGRLVDGASGASVSVAQAAATDLGGPEDRPRVLGLRGAAFGLGFTVGPAIGGIAAWAGGRRAPFYVAAVLAFVNGLVAIVRLPETRPRRTGARLGSATELGPESPAPANDSVPLGGDSTSNRRRWLRFGTIPELRRFLVVAFFAIASFSGFEATFSLLGEHRFALTESSAAWVFVGIGVLSSVVQGGAIGPITELLGSGKVLRLGLAANVVGLVALAAAEHWWLLVVALVFLVIGQGLSTPSISTIVANRAGEHRRGLALGEQQAVGALARVAGPALAGVLFDVRIPLPYLVGAGLMALSLAILLGDREPNPERVNAPGS
jgi:DHA1 family tetracycline resistance protein-like MFS transporter